LQFPDVGSRGLFPDACQLGDDRSKTSELSA
jgi:hypothetical protein